MKKRIIAALLASALVMALAACGGTAATTAAPTTKAAEKTEAPAGDDKETEAKETEAKETEAKETEAAETAAPAPDTADLPEYTLKYVEIGNQDCSRRTAVEAAISEYIKPLINASIEFQIVAWGDWTEKAITALQSGQEMDIVFTADWQHYLRSVQSGSFNALNDPEGPYGDLMATYGQDILATLNPAFITGTQINGINYAVPTNKELAVPNGWLYNVDKAKEYDFVPLKESEGLMKVQDFEPYLAAMKEAEPNTYPYLFSGGNGDEPWVPGFTNFGVITMVQDPDENGNFDETIVNMWESDYAMQLCQTMFDWAQKGYIHPDAALTTFNDSDIFKTGEFLIYQQPLKGNNIKAQERVNASGNNALNIDEIYGQKKVVTTTHTGGSMLAIPVTSNDPERAMMYINMMHRDTDLLNMMLYGVPGEDWEIDEGDEYKRVSIINAEWSGAHGGAWTFGNTALQTPTILEDPEKNQLLQDYAIDAVPHPSLGFRFDQTSVEAMVAALNNVRDTYERSLYAGAIDPVVNIPKFNDEMRAAGLDEIMAEVQRQYDEWKAALEG